MKKKVGIIASSVATIAVCASMVVGSTYALFTSEDKVDISVTAGKVEVTATVDENSLALTSMGEVQEGKTWANGGKAGFTDKSTLTLNDVTPGDGASFDIKVTNNSTVNIKYKLSWSVEGELADVLETTAIGAKVGAWDDWTVGSASEKKVTVSVLLPESVGNEYQEKTADISFAVEAVQGNTDISSYDKTVWDGVTADVSWYDATATESVYTIETPAQFAGFAALVNEGNNFSGKTVQLGTDIDLNNEAWTPIGGKVKEIIPNADPTKKPTYKYYDFCGTFNGAGYTVKNLVIDGGEYNKAVGEQAYVGLFGILAGGNVNDLTVENADVKGVQCVGVIAGGWTGTITNCKVKGDIKVEGNYKVGGIIGDSYTKITNCSVVGNDGSYVKGIYDKADLEGDNVGGIIGFTGEDSSNKRVHSGNYVENITVSGTRKVGGAIGYLHEGVTVSETTVKNSTVETNATESYVNANGGKILIGAIVGEHSNIAKEISNCAAYNVYVVRPVGYDDDYSGIVGGTRSNPNNTEIINNVAENVYVSRYVFVSVNDFASAIADLQNGDTLVLSEGNYTVPSNKISADNVTIKGAGANTVLDCGANEISKQAGMYIEGDNVTIEDLTITSTSTNGNVTALKISNVANPVNCTVKNVTISSEKGNGLTLHGVKNAVVDNVTVTAYKCGFAVACAENVVFTNCTVEVCETEGSWHFDIGCMYRDDKKSDYPKASTITLGEGNNFKNKWIYGEHPDGDKVYGYDSSWTLTYKTGKDGETLKTWDLKKN